MSEKIFIDGLIVKPPRQGAPAFVKAAISFNVPALKKFLTDHGNTEWLNIDVKESKGGKWYAELNTWQKGAVKSEPLPTIEYPRDEVNTEDVPF